MPPSGPSDTDRRAREIRSGINQGGYFGETIDIQAVLSAILAVARNQDWETHSLRARPDCQLLTLHRRVQSPRKRIYVSTGIHGDEPAGPRAMLQLLEENLWPRDIELWLCPCLNPTGFPLNRRESAAGLDLNRDYRHFRSDEIRAHVDWLNTLPHFDLTLCLHEDWEAHGFYLYELNPDRQSSLARTMVDQVQRVCPIDPSPMIDGRPATQGIICPSLDPASRPEWPEAFYLIQNKTRLSYTLEAPSDFPMATRTHALVAAVQAALHHLQFPSPPTSPTRKG